jgi:hypothetical protein
LKQFIRSVICSTFKCRIIDRKRCFTKTFRRGCSVIFNGSRKSRKAEGGQVAKGLTELHLQLKDLDPSAVDFAKSGLLGSFFYSLESKGMQSRIRDMHTLIY